MPQPLVFYLRNIKYGTKANHTFALSAVNMQLPGSQPERNKETSKQDKERKELAESFSDGVSRLSTMNSKMDRLKVVEGMFVAHVH